MSSGKSRRTVLCDASPLIFLAKVNQLGLLEAIPGGDCVVLSCVAREVLEKPAGPVEKQRLEAWLSTVRQVDYEGSLFTSDALSGSDHSSLAWAVANRADWLVADDRLLRRFARERGISVIGFCGILLKAVPAGLLSVGDVRALIDDAIGNHGFRISIALYRAILEELDSDARGA